MKRASSRLSRSLTAIARAPSARELAQRVELSVARASVSSPSTRRSSATTLAWTRKAFFARSWSSDALPEHVIVPMPALSPTMTRGGIASWHVQVGQAIRAGDAIADVETDKATMAMEATEDGFMAAILVEAGAQDIEVGTPVCVTCENAEDVEAFKDYASTVAIKAESAAPVASAPSGPIESPLVAPVASAPSARATRAETRASGDRVFASPLAKRLAKERGVRLENVRGTGPNGRVIAADVHEAHDTGVNATEAVREVTVDHPLSKFFPDFEDVSVTAIKRVTAQRLTESKQQVPHFYLTVDVRLDNMISIRQTLNKQLADDKATEGAKISVNDFIVKASAKALLAVPEVNSSWLGDKIRRYKKADISVAVQTERGLMVPIVRSACCLGLKTISSEVKALAGRAREGSLTPQDMTGGTFTISNLGMFGVKSFAAIVNPPQAAILAVGGARKEVIKNESGGYEEITVMSATLSCDHRVVDGAVGAMWLQSFKGYIEDPMTMLL